MKGYRVHHDESSGVVQPVLPAASTVAPASLGSSYPVHGYPFQYGNLCVALGKKSHGLPWALARHCDSFIHIPHEEVFIAPGSTASPYLLDIQSCLSIALHQFTRVVGYDERTFEGHKFEVARGVAALDSRGEDKRDAREEQRRLTEAEADATIGEASLGSMFADATDY